MQKLRNTGNKQTSIPMVSRTVFSAVIEASGTFHVTAKTKNPIRAKNGPAAFGPYRGFQQGWMKWLSGVIDNALYPCFGMILEFIAFVRLRMKYSAVSRPSTIGAVLMCVPPTILICVVLALSTFKVMGLSVFAIVIGLVLQPFLKYPEKKRSAKFSASADLPDLHNAHEITSL
nr:amino acid permease-like protein [Tanacetum cinerariifolium]